MKWSCVYWYDGSHIACLSSHQEGLIFGSSLTGSLKWYPQGCKFYVFIPRMSLRYVLCWGISCFLLRWHLVRSHLRLCHVDCLGVNNTIICDILILREEIHLVIGQVFIGGFFFFFRIPLWMRESSMLDPFFHLLGNSARTFDLDFIH